MVGKHVKISGNLMVLNEVRNIARVINNLFEFCDEIVVLDGGSTDGTTEYIVSLHDSRIKLYIWPQRHDSEYSREWEEARRRTLMMRLSDGDYILWLDADECMDDSFADFLAKIKSKNLVCFLPMYHFWKSIDRIRVNAGNDRVWYPSYHLRLFPNSDKFSCFSYRKDGMHTKTVKKVLGVKIPIGLRYIYFSDFLTPLLKVFSQWILGVKFVVLKDIHVFHYHYLDGYKKADLRMADRDKKEELVLESEGDVNPQRSGAVLVKAVSVKQPKAFTADGQ